MTRPTTARPAATPWPAAWPACSPPTPCSVPSSSPLARQASTPTAPGASSTPTCAGRRSCGADWSAGSTRRHPTYASPTRSTRLRAGGDRPRPAAAAVALRPHPAPRDGGGTARARSASCATCTSGCRRPRPSCGSALAPTARAGQVPRAADDVGRGGRPPAAQLAGARLARAAPHPRRLPTVARRLPPDAARHPARLAAARPARQHRARRRDPVLPQTADESVQVHACHGAARQVDVLREVLVGLLADDPTLEPRDILVMCPDIETYAPLISAAFGMADVAVAGAGHPGHQLRVRLADRSLAATNPLLARRRPAGRARARADDGQPGARRRRRRAGARPLRLRRRRARAHHPLGRRRRDPLGLRRRPPQHASGSAASRPTPGPRACTGSCWAPRCPGSTTGRCPAPCPSTTSATATSSSVGRFAELVDRLHTFLDGAESAVSVTDWTRALGDAVHRLTTTPTTDVWQVAQFDRELSRIDAGAGDSTTLLRQADVRALLRQRLRGRAHPLQLPHRHADGLHDGADAVGPAPRGLPGRSRRRGVPACCDRRRRRRPGPPTPHGRARPAGGGPPAAPRRDRRGHRQARHHLHRSWRAHRRGATARRAPGRAARRARPHRSRAGAQPRRDPPPAAALRRGQLRRRAPAGRRRLHLRPVRARGREGSARRPLRPSGCSCPRRCRSRSRRPTDVSLADLQDFFAHPVRGILPPAAHRQALRRRRGEGLHPDHPRRAREVGRGRPPRRRGARWAPTRSRSARP